jgi:hypothetical protein
MEEVLPKTTQEQIIEEAETLEKPTESVAFLRYMMKHAERVEVLQQRLASFSRGLMATGVLVAGYAAMVYMTSSTAEKPHGRLSSGHGESSVEQTGLNSMFNGISVVIWSMIAAKAKTGYSAANDGKAKNVQSALKQAGTLICLIALASGFNIYAAMNDVQVAAPIVAPGPTSVEEGVKLLKGGHSTPSTVKSSHYKGGAAAAAMEEFSKMSSEDFHMKKGPSKKNLKAPEDRGMKIQLENAPQIGKKAAKSANINLVIEALEKKSPKKLTAANNSEQKFKEVSAYLLFVLTTGISIAYYVTFRTYHTALAKMESLKKLLSNPNARVAAGNKGKSILKRLNADKKKAEAPKKIVKSTSGNETANLLKQLIDARQTEKQYEKPLLEQSAPKKALKKDSTLDQIKKVLAERKQKKPVVQ